MANITEVAICATTCKMGMPEGDLETRFRYAARRAHDYWGSIDDVVRFPGAVAAVFEDSTKEEQQRITDALDGMRKVSALLNAAKAGLNVSLGDMDLSEAHDPAPLMAWFKEERPS